ncbi:hypothetical protein CHQ57_08345 [Aeromonas salmonicida]|nr:hypothetical protein CHQ57_08345 [Aeromonas salmonicida]
MDDGAAAVGTGMCRLRRSVRPVGRDEGTREAGGLPGEKTFGVICQRERVFQKSLAKPRSGGEILSRAEPSRPAWQSHANQERGKVSALRQTTNKNRSPCEVNPESWTPNE